MAIVDADWSIDEANGNIRYIGDDHTEASPSYATVIEFHRWLQDKADDATFAGDDEMDITIVTPSDRSTDNIITLINGFNIDNTAAEHLYDGSIIQNGGDTIYDGIVNFGNNTVVVQVIQNGAVLTDDWWNYSEGGTHTGAADAAVLTDSGKTWTVNEWAGHVLLNTTDGSHGIIASNTATTITLDANGMNGGTENDFDNTDAYLIADGLNSDSAGGISHRFMVKVRENGVDIDGRRLIGTNRTFGRTFGEFKINGTSRGNNVLALSDSDDLNNTTDQSVVSGWSTITNTEGLRLIDISGDGSAEEYFSEWNRDTYTINQLFERAKHLTADGSGSTIHAFNGENFRGITHSFPYDAETGTAPTTNDDLAWGTRIDYDNEASGPFTVGEAVHENTATPTWKGRIIAIDDNTTSGSLIVDIESGGTVTDNESFTGQSSGATADVNLTPTAVAGGGLMRVLAFDDDGTVGNLYVQVTKGNAPADNTVLYNCTTDTSAIDVANNLTVNGSPTERPISTPFLGASTGTALIGAYGIGIEAADTSASDIFTDLSNTTINPPNNVTFTVSGLESGEDRVLVGPESGGVLQENQLSLSGTLSTDNVGSVVVTTAIPTDTPSSGTIRVQDDNGLYRRLEYSGYTGSTFTISSVDGNEDFLGTNATSGNNVFISYIDKLAAAAEEDFTSVYLSDRPLFIRVRDGGASPIKTFETTGSLGSAGGSSTAIRTSDE